MKTPKSIFQEVTCIDCNSIIRTALPESIKQNKCLQCREKIAGRSLLANE